MRKTLAGVSAVALMAAAVAFVGPKEGTRLKPYRDAGGILTVCIGETHVEMRTYTWEECKEMFAKSLREYGEHVENCITQPMSITTEKTFWSLAYNVGWQGFCRSRIVALYNAGKREEACRAIEGYAITQRGVGVLPGLVTRRKSESATCLAGLKEAAP